MSTAGTVGRFRRQTFVESVAQAFPRRGIFDGVRRRFRGAYERLLTAGSDSLTSVLPEGEVVRIAPEQRHMTWNLLEYQALRAAVRPGDTVIDAGANVGCYAILFGRWVGQSGRVYAFEPDPRAFEGLTRHIALNGLDGIVTPIRAAISDRPRASAPFTLAVSSGVSRLAASKERDTIGVAATSIDDFCAQARISPRVIKIDVEGAELDALRGARDTIAQVKDLRLFVEMHPSLWLASGITARDLQKECDAQRLTVEPIDGVSGDVWAIEGITMRVKHS